MGMYTQKKKTYRRMQMACNMSIIILNITRFDFLNLHVKEVWHNCFNSKQTMAVPNGND